MGNSLTLEHGKFCLGAMLCLCIWFRLCMQEDWNGEIFWSEMARSIYQKSFKRIEMICEKDCRFIIKMYLILTWYAPFKYLYHAKNIIGIFPTSGNLNYLGYDLRLGKWRTSQWHFSYFHKGNSWCLHACPLVTAE